MSSSRKPCSQALLYNYTDHPFPTSFIQEKHTSYGDHGRQIPAPKEKRVCGVRKGMEYTPSWEESLWSTLIGGGRSFLPQRQSGEIRSMRIAMSGQGPFPFPSHCIWMTCSCCVSSEYRMNPSLSLYFLPMRLNAHGLVMFVRSVFHPLAKVLKRPGVNSTWRGLL